MTGTIDMRSSRRSVLKGGACAVVAASGGVAPASAAPEILRIAVASNMHLAMPEIIAAFQAETGILVNVSYGATATLARQLRQGAPFQLFFSADEMAITGLARDGVVPAPGIVYAEGRLSLVAAIKGPFASDFSLGAIANEARQGMTFRFAIADPDVAPYGRAAFDVLERWSIDELLRRRIVHAESVAQALQLVATGNAAAGIVARGIARAPAVRHAVIDMDIPTSWHRPIVQRMALTAIAGDTARRLYTFMLMPNARAILARHGFIVPFAQG